MTTVAQLQQIEEEMKQYMREHEQEMTCVDHGVHPDKGSRLGAKKPGIARCCSADIRAVYPPNVLRDDGQIEFCVDSRQATSSNNPCTLCQAQHTQFRQQIPADGPVSFAEFFSLIGKKYPDTKPTIWRIFVNDVLLLDCYIRLIPFSSMIRAKSPSGHEHKDRCSVGTMVKMQSAMDKNIIFYVTKNASYKDLDRETEQAVVNAVGFWGFRDDNKKIKRHILQINEEHATNVCFGFFVKNAQQTRTMKVEIETSKGVKKTVWSYQAERNDTRHAGHVTGNENAVNEHAVSVQREPPREPPQRQLRAATVVPPNIESGQHPHDHHIEQNIAPAPTAQLSSYGPVHAPTFRAEMARYSPLSSHSLQRSFMHLFQEIDTLRRRVQHLESQRAFVPYDYQYLPPPQTAYPSHGVPQHAQQQHAPDPASLPQPTYYSPPNPLRSPVHHHHDRAYQHPTVTSTNSDHSMLQSPTSSTATHSNSPQSPIEHRQMEPLAAPTDNFEPCSLMLASSMPPVPNLLNNNSPMYFGDVLPSPLTSAVNSNNPPEAASNNFSEIDGLHSANSLIDCELQSPFLQ